MSSSIKIADIVINDDVLGVNTLNLTGIDAASFEIVGGTELHLRAGTALDAVGQPSLNVTVEVANLATPVDDGGTLPGLRRDGARAA